MNILILALMLAFSGFAFSEYYPAPDYRVVGEPHSNADKVAIDELIEAFKTAWAEEDAAGAAAVHSADANAAVLNTVMDSDRGSSVGSGNRRVSLNLVLEKIGGEWKIVHQVITDLREMRSSN